MDDGEATSSRLRRSHASLSSQKLNCPVLESCRKLKPEFNHYNRIPITSDNFSLGHGLKNSVIVPFISISRNHCQFKKGKNNEWTIEDNSSFGIKINGVTLGKGLEKRLCDGDIISLEYFYEFVYKFLNSPSEEFEVPRKRLKMDNRDQNNKKMTKREEIQNQLNEAQNNAEISFEELRMRVTERETELAALSAERLKKQTEQSSLVINTLKEQLEKVKSQLQTVETERNTILENICAPENCGESSSKEMVLNEIGELMESELQCSICNELFVEPTTLNCSHTFCKYCISAWKKKKKECPICRASIRTECKSLVLNSFIEKMVQSLSKETKRKRKEILETRKGQKRHRRTNQKPNIKL